MTPAASSSKPMGARSAGLPGGDGAGGDCVGGDCGPGPAGVGRAASRSIFASCSLRRVSCSSACVICSWACASRSSARPVGPSRGSVSFGSGVEFIGVSFSVQCHPKVTVDHLPALRAVLSKEWPYDGRILDRMAIAPWKPAGRCRRRSPMAPAALQFHSAGRKAHPFMRAKAGRVRARCELVGR